jgi:hypothetical protein
MLSVLALVAIVAARPAHDKIHGLNATGIDALVEYADKTWNCAGDAPPCPGCTTVASGSAQSPYGCAPFVAHCLAAGGFVPLDKCGSIGSFDDVRFGGKSYNLNVVSKQDPNCGGGLCLMDYLKARGWTKASSVKAGTVCAVQGEDGGHPVPWGHIVIGVGAGIVDAHNMAHKHVPISNYIINELLDPPA